MAQMRIIARDSEPGSVEYAGRSLLSALLEAGEVRIRRRGADRIRGGHLWVYRSDVVEPPNPTPAGSIVLVRDERGVAIGKALYSSASQIALRFLTRGSAANVPINEAFLRYRIDVADQYRNRIGVDPKLSRRVYSEGDLLPGLIVDRYGDTLVVQSLCQGIDKLEPIFTPLLQERYRPRSIVFRNDARVRELEGLALEQHTIGEPVPETIMVNEDGKEYEVALLKGQKTGTFLDQRENHRAARRYAHGKALDGCTYAGGFALQIAEACQSVEAIDISAASLEVAQANALRNGLENIHCIEANIFDYLREASSQGKRYDTIVLDPPAFARNKESLQNSIRGYKEINNRAMRLLNDGGILITCSCSHHVSESIFAGMLAEAAQDAGCWARVIERRIQSADHPVMLTIPETLYLKCFILQIKH
jgi:23S rRNA (cytosine1962-C5)-methyltransferase